MFWIYMLRCADGSYYVGHTDDLEHRLGQHREGRMAGYTHRRRPVVLVYAREMASRVEALATERQIKGWSRGKKEALARGDWATVRMLAKGRHRHER